ncbi:MAG: SagB/ThcOx family dehydrogenase [Endomicrobiales bacterium]|nr:SagB/ThcOx family dehydrogenase [Endomicrobiales bacterium]
MINLPQPKLKGTLSVEEALFKRRSIRSYADKPLTQDEISQILWSAQGVTEKASKMRTAPSAGARYPMEIYLVNADGLFHYHPEKHSLEKIRSGDLRNRIADAAHGQSFIAKAGATVIISVDPPKITSRYGDRGIRYLYMEAGHIAQNIHLQAVAMDLSSVPVGAFSDEGLKDVLNLPDELKPIYLIPVGHTRK